MPLNRTKLVALRHKAKLRQIDLAARFAVALYGAVSSMGAGPSLLANIADDSFRMADAFLAHAALNQPAKAG